MFLSTLLMVASLMVLALAGERNFAPSIPDMDFHKQRLWFQLNPKCFATEQHVFDFKDHVVSNYDCVAFKKSRKRIYQTTTATGNQAWSLWLELRNPNWDDFGCLSQNTSLPAGIESECIMDVLYEPLQYPLNDVDAAVPKASGLCMEQVTASTRNIDLWSLDVLDGIEDGVYEYFDADAGVEVEAIVLDSDIDYTHIEFQGLPVTNLFDGVLNPQASQEHGTHVAATVVGNVVGGAKDVPLSFYPVCQIGPSCGWSDIEAGYEAAIALMEANPSKKYVVNFSVGGPRRFLTSFQYNNWARRIQEAGNFLVAAAGNEADDACSYAPAFSSYVITVGSFDETMRPSFSFTNYGECVDTWGPGEYVWSAYPGGGYTAFKGTSMASPNVASMVINIAKANPSMTLNDMKEYLRTNSEPLEDVPSGWVARRAFIQKCS